jgi:hypothetical protein
MVLDLKDDQGIASSLEKGNDSTVFELHERVKR